MIAMTIINSTSVKPASCRLPLVIVALSLLVAGVAEFAALREHSWCSSSALHFDFINHELRYLS
jgi:hypothetical protein